MMTLRFDMMSKMYRGKSGPCHGETLVIQIDPKVMVWYLMWLSIILAADTTSNIFSELVNLQRRGWCLREYKRHSSSSRIAFKPWILNMLIYFVRAWTISFEIFHHLISDSFVKLFLSLDDNEMQKICKTYITASCVQFTCLTLYLSTHYIPHVITSKNCS